MCLSPRKIYNRSIWLNEDSSAVFQEVPCGHCPDCVDIKTQEYKLRSYYEWLEVKQNGGFAYFDTLTLNNVSFYNPSRNYRGVKTFNKKDITLFLHKLHQRCKDKYSFRYFLSSEYGGIYKRPHYHVIFFIIPLINKDKDSYFHAHKFRNFIYQSWTEPQIDKNGNIEYISKDGKRFPKTRSLGFIDKYGTINERVVTSAKALAYVSKYVVKQDDYISDLRQVISSDHVAIQKCKEENDLLGYKDADDRAINILMRPLLPFHRQSQGYGLSLLYCLAPSLRHIVSSNGYNNLYTYLRESKDTIQNHIELFGLTKNLRSYVFKRLNEYCGIRNLMTNPEVVNISLSAKPIKLPLYYLRKLFYKVQPNGTFDPESGKPRFSWIPTTLGIQFNLIQMEKRIDRYTDKYTLALNTNIAQIMPHGYILQSEIQKLLGERSIRDFIIYKLIYKGKLHNNYAFGTDASNWYDFYKKSLISSKTLENYMYDDNPEIRKDFRKYLRSQSINEDINPIWHGFDVIDFNFNDYFKYLGDYKTNVRTKLNRIKQRLKQFSKL